MSCHQYIELLWLHSSHGTRASARARVSRCSQSCVPMSAEQVLCAALSTSYPWLCTRVTLAMVLQREMCFAVQEKPPLLDEGAPSGTFLLLCFQ